MTASPFALDGRTAVVTGASRGIGLAMSEALAQAGADVIAVASRPLRENSAVERAVRSHGRAFHARHADFADLEAVAALGDELSASNVDILVNNAGTIERAPAAQHPLESWRRVLDVDLTSHFVLTQKLGTAMLDRGHGRVIFTASLLSFQGGINVPGYAAAKSGIAGLTRALSNEWVGQGVTVNAIAPGYIATDNTQALQDDPDRSRSILDRIPAGRWGAARDIGGATVFLSSEAAAYVSGIILPVDGGWLAR